MALIIVLTLGYCLYHGITLLLTATGFDFLLALIGTLGAIYFLQMFARAAIEEFAITRKRNRAAYAALKEAERAKELIEQTKELVRIRRNSP